MKIYTDGARHLSGQVARIDDGFRQLGHELTPYLDDADLIYVNDPPHYKQVVADKVLGRLRGKVIFNVLDLPLHLKGEFDYEGLNRQLAFADAITSISEYVQWQLRAYLTLDSTVVYQPIKGVARDAAARVECPYRFASVGRRLDSNKNVSIWAAALQILGISPKEVALAGNEPGWGDYLGVQSDENLNHLYNSVDFVLALGTVEGLNLPAIEAIACGTIPVVYKGLTTLEELFPATTFPEYQEVELTPESVARFIGRYLNNAEAMAEMKERLHGHFVANLQEKVSPAGVARRILEVFERL